MPGRKANRPPPAGGARRHRFPWHRGDGQRAPQRTEPAYERSDAAEQERVIIEALADLRDMDVREVMTPRMDVVSLTIPVSAEDVARAVRESGHSCFPVVNGGLDDLVGVLYVNDLCRSRRADRGGLLGASGQEHAEQEVLPLSPPVSSSQVPAIGAVRHPAADRHDVREPVGLSPIEISRRIRQPYVIPESRPILAALVEMRRHRRGFAVVVDEYGGVAGVLTVKDLLEPIVGELHDELDIDEEPSMVRVDNARWLVDGRTNVDEVRERLGIDIPEGDYVTLGGYLFDGLGHIPLEGETLRVDGWDLVVQEMDKRRIAKVVARRRDEAEQISSTAFGVVSGDGSQDEPVAAPYDTSPARSVDLDRPSDASG